MLKLKKFFYIEEDFFTEEEYKKVINIINTIKFPPIRSNKGRFFGFRESYDLKNHPEFNWIIDKSKEIFFKNKKVSINEIHFHMRHNKNKVGCHYDDVYSDYNVLIYLEGKPLMYNGTGFWTKFNKKENSQELDLIVGFKPNRALCFNGRDVLHSDLQALGESSMRYTINLFFKEEEKNNLISFNTKEKK